MTISLPDDAAFSALPRNQQIELVCSAFDAALKAQANPSLEDYVQRFSADDFDAVLESLLRLELEFRRRRGDEPKLHSYVTRFPAGRQVIQRLFGADETHDLGTTYEDSRFPTQARREEGYTILQEHAQGGLGKVSLARDQALKRTVAVKEIRSDRWSPAAQARFLNEAEITGQLEHPGIVPIYALEYDAAGRPYYAMRFIEGQTMSERMRCYHERPSSKGFNELLSSFVDLCQALGYAHSRDVIHRDLKPANVMLGQFGETLVLDWGLAKRIKETEGSTHAQAGDTSSAFPESATSPGDKEVMTFDGTVLGTPAYMAPEQARGEVDRLDARSDVFGLGAILCKLLTGDPPYPGNDGRVVLELAAKADVASVFRRLDASGADRELVRIAKHCLAANKEDRPANASRVADAIMNYQAQVRDQLHQAEIERAAAESKARVERQRKWFALALAIVAGLLLIVGGTAWWNHQREYAAAQFDARQLIEQASKRVVAAEQNLDNLQKMVSLLASATTDLETAAKLIERRRLVLPKELLLARDQTLAQLATTRANHRLLTQFRQADELFAEARDSRVEVDQRRAPLATLEKAFSEWGVDINQESPKSVIAKIERQPDAMRSRIADYLQVYLTHFVAADSDAPKEWFTAVFQGIDNSAYRNQVRKALASGDEEYLKKTLSQIDVAEHPVVFVTSVAEWVYERDPEAGLDLLDRATLTYPQDFYLASTAGNLRLLDLFDPRPMTTAETNRLWDGIRHYSRAITIRTDSAISFYNLGLAFDTLGESKSAMRCYLRSIAIDPQFARAHTNLGNVYRRQKRYEEALRCYQLAMRADPEQFEVYLNLGVLYHSKGDFEASIAAYREALRRNQDEAHTYYNLGISLQDNKKIEEAIIAYRDALERDATIEGAWLRIGTCYQELGQNEQAVETFEELRELNADSGFVHRYIGNAYQGMGDIERAREAYERAIRADPRDADSHFRLAKLIQSRGDPKRAVEIYRLGLMYQPRSAIAYANLGAALHELNRLPEARAAIQTALDLNPELPEAHFNRGVVLKAQDDLDGAEGAFRRATQLSPDFYLAHYSLGHLLDATVRKDAAVACFRRAIEIQPDSLDAHYSLGNTLIDLRKLEDAEAAFRRLIALEPTYAEAHCNLGGCLKLQGRFEESLQCYVRGHELGTAQADWRYPSEKWIRNAEQAVRLDKALKGYREVGGASVDVKTKLAMANFGRRYKRDYSAAARLYAEVFEAIPALIPGYRYHAACTAAAAIPAGNDSAELTTEQLDQLRQWALNWLRADFEKWKSEYGKGTAQRKQARETLADWLQESMLASVREEASLKRFPIEQQQVWRNLWAEVKKIARQE